MGSNGGGAAPPLIGLGRRQSDLRKSFNLAVRSLLTTCPKQEFSKAFPNFTSAEQERLHQLFIQVITSLHGNVEDEFKSLCQETQVATALDTVEQLVEEQHLDPLISDKTNIMDVVHNLSTAKKAEIQYLRGLLERAEEHNHLIQARVELLKNRRQEVSSTKDVEKVRGGILSYGEHKMSGFSDLQLVG
ncbi:Embryo defective 3006, putative isoform 2 [Theobroma cacao]|uniref:Embryo defective 3006, putative isoform 2 n=1 Tax=Theobroma cacao TaxID=3641 RepID=A0A061G7I3_THECC|nr:Embryo defective 3006, putative isoform 2 [Theobroma cacao]